MTLFCLAVSLWRLFSYIPGIDKEELRAVERYAIGYLAFWHIVFVGESRLVPCDEALRTAAPISIH